MERKHSIITAFLLFWFIPDIVNNLMSIEVNEFVIDGSLRVCIMLLMYEFYTSVNFSRIYLKAALLLSLVGTIYEICSYTVISIFLFHPLLDTIILITKLIGLGFGFIALVQLILSYHYKGKKITRNNKPKEVKGRWRP